MIMSQKVYLIIGNVNYEENEVLGAFMYEEARDNEYDRLTNDLETLDRLGKFHYFHSYSKLDFTLNERKS